MKKTSTSWGTVAQWYQETLENPESYQQKVIAPNLTRVLGLKPGIRVLDIACGEGWFARACHALGAAVTGIDIAAELIDRARKVSSKEITYLVGSADKLEKIQDHSVDRAVVILALQNIENVAGVFQQCARVLRKSGTLSIVMNHPAFRIPSGSSWGWDDGKKVQYRRVDQYCSEFRQEILMHPGSPKSPKTLSFHRPLQWYWKALAKAGFSVGKLEEWISHKVSQKGPRAAAEDRARKEIPLFLFMEAHL